MTNNEIGGALGSLIIVAALAITLMRMWVRARLPTESADLKAIAERLDRIEQSIDAMSIETERISEGQRFTTKLLSEKAKDALPRA